MKKITELEQLEDELHKELVKVRKELHEARVLACGVKVGDVVIYKGVKHRVTEIDPSWNPPWLKGNPMKVDGTFGKADRQLFSYWKRST